MNKEVPITPRESSLGFFFPQSDPLPQLSESDYKNIKFRGNRIDLEVYHLAYGTIPQIRVSFPQLELATDAHAEQYLRRIEFLFPILGLSTIIKYLNNNCHVKIYTVVKNRSRPIWHCHQNPETSRQSGTCLEGNSIRYNEQITKKSAD